MSVFNVHLSTYSFYDNPVNNKCALIEKVFMIDSSPVNNKNRDNIVQNRPR